MLALQTVTCMATYLITASATSRAHMFIGMAAAAAIRMGLHLPSTGCNVPYHEQIVRKRTYRCILAIDIYMATFLGQPCCLQGVDGYHDYVHQFDMDQLAMLHPHDDVQVAAEACMQAFVILRSSTQESYFNKSKPGPGEVYSVPCSITRSYNRRLDDWFASIVNLNLPG